MNELEKGWAIIKVPALSVNERKKFVNIKMEADLSGFCNFAPGEKKPYFYEIAFADVIDASAEIKAQMEALGKEGEQEKTLTEYLQDTKHHRADILDLREWLDWGSLRDGLGDPDIWLFPEHNYAPGQQARLYRNVDLVVHVERWGYRNDQGNYRFLERITKLEILKKAHKEEAENADKNL